MSHTPPVWRKVAAYFLRAFSFSIFATALFGGHALRGQTSPVLLFAGETNRPAGSKVIDMSSGNSVLTGGIHCNSDIDVSGTGNFFRTGVVEHVTGVVPPPDFPGKVTLQNCPVVASSVTGWPVYYRTNDFAPGSQEAVAAQAAGKYFHVMGDTDLSAFISSGVLREGLYYVEGKVNLSKGGLTGHVTVVATKEITISGTGENWLPYTRCLLFFSARALAYNQPAINVSGGSSRWEGVIFAPNAGVQISGSGNVVARGALVARGIHLSGGSLNFTGMNFTDCPSAGASNQPPVVDAGGDQAIAFPTNTVTLSGSVSDDGLPNGTWTAVWSTVSGPASVVFSQPSTTNTQPTTTVTFSASGMYVLRLTANDGQLTSSDDVVVTVNRENHPPQALPQSVVIDEDASTNITLQGTDADGDPLSYTVTVVPTHGTLTLNSQLSTNNSVYTYAPETNYNGADQFTFKVSDGVLESSNAIVAITIRPVNDVPVADAILLTNTEDTAVAITLSGSDADGDALTYRVIAGPTNGTLSGPLTGSLTGTNGALTYLPNTNFFGADQVTYVLNDGTTDSAPKPVTLTIVPVDDLPMVDAGPDQVIVLPTSAVSLAGTVIYDAYPGTVDTVQWAKVSGPGSVTFSDASNEVTSATFSTNGIYVLRLTASDSVLTNSDDVVVTVDAPPVVTAGPAQTNTLPATIQLNGTVTDDGLPTNDVLSIEWSKISGPGSVVFSDPSAAATTAAFSESGVYVLRLTASDGAATASSNVIVLVNQAPLVDAGSARAITNLQTVLNGTVFDDGLPNGSFVTTWSEVSGPGTVAFSKPTETNSQPTTTATFSQTGVYVLQLIADDSLAVSSNQVTINVDAAPAVNAGNDQLITFPATATLTATASDDGIPEGSSLTYQWTQVNGPGTVAFGDAAALSTTASFSQPGSYVLRFAASDSLLNSVDELIVTVNQAPTVNAGPDAIVTIGVSVLLQGSVQDDGVPTGGSLTTSWTVVSGPGAAMLITPDSPVTQISFAAEGIYVLRLTASDSLATNSDEVTITAIRPNRAPVVSAGPKQLVTLPAGASLLGSVTDDGLPLGASVTVAWSTVSGPGTVSFANSNSTNTAATFSDAGDYVLRLTATDTEFTTSSDVQVKVRTAGMNEAPIVSAGPDKVIGLTNVAALEGSVRDDGLPQGAEVTASWSLVSGPGTVAFDHSDRTNAHATFSAVGTYVLRLTGSDTALSASDDVSITVYPYNQPPIVDAGPDQTITIPDPAVLSLSGVNPTNANTELSISLQEREHWDFAIGQPGLFNGSGVTGNALEVSEGRVYAAGDFMRAGNLPSIFWDGNTNSSARSMAMWDGTNWHNFYDPRPIALPDPPGSVPGLHTGTQGTNIAFGVTECGNFEFCNENFDCLTVRGSNVFAAGSFKELEEVSDGLSDMVDRWSGTGWEEWGFKYSIHGGGPNVIKSTRDKVYIAGGEYSFQTTNAIPGIFTNLIWHWGVTTWDGTNWGAIDMNDLRGDSNLIEVTSMAVATNGDLYVAGNFLLITPTGIATNIARWDGSQWRRLGGGIPGFSQAGAPFTALAIGENGDVYAGGLFTNAGGVTAHNIARWDGSRWWPLTYGPNEGVDGPVRGIGVHGRDVYVVGVFANAGGVPAWRFAKWDGQFWRSLASGTLIPNGTPAALAVDDTGVYIAGDFSRIGTNVANSIAKWVFPQIPPRVATLNGHVTDDGLPVGAPLTATWNKVSGPGNVTFADPNSPSTTASFTKAGTYVVRLTANDTEFTTLDEATIVVQGNKPPTVDAGPDQVINPLSSALLHASVTDDGLPQGVEVAYVWSVFNGPGTVTFDNPTSTNTTVHFSTAGTYILRFSANDSQYTAFDDVTITVLSSTQDNEPPTVNTGGDLGNIPYTSVITLIPTQATDDGRPLGVTNFLWSQLSGPGVVTFGSPTNKTTTAAFSAPGVYVVRLSANDTELANFDDLQITTIMPVNNTAPKVNAGPAQTVTNQLTAQLTGSVSDDGLPPGVPLTVFWSFGGSGPTGGTVTYVNSNSPVTTVIFNKPGTYGLDLNATDGQFFSSSRVFITIPNQAPVPNAGPDRTITTLSFLLTGSATDDGPASSLTASWSRISGPGIASFSNPSALTNTVTFTSLGTNVLRLTVFDGNSSVFDSVTIVVAPTNNQPPSVSAGAGSVLTWPSNSVVLNGAISDDGHPSGVTLASWSTFSGPGTVTFGQTTFSNAQPVTTATFSQMGTYVLRLTGTDLVLTNAADVIVRVVPPNPPNQPPVVDAGPDQSVLLTNTLTLTGNVTDDGNPFGSVLSAFWSKVSGPGPVYFGNGFTNLTTNVVTTARFIIPGQYVLRLSASDSAVNATDDVTITVLPLDPNLAPVVSAGADVMMPQYAHQTLAGSVSDDGLPYGFVVTGWTVSSGPGRAYFENAAATNSAVTFFITGSYVLRLTATDGRLSVFDEVTVTVVPPINDPPTVDAGNDQTVVRPNAALLLGAVYDDGLPFGYPLTYQWSVVSGPGTVTFVTTNNTTDNATYWEAVQGVDAFASATFSKEGTYVLRLTGTDSQYTNSSQVTITVLPGINSPPQVNAGPDFATALSEATALHTEATDDGLENGWLEITWSQVSGPGSVYFSTINGTYYATFTTGGTYVLRLSANDGELTGTDDVAVTVYDAPPPEVQITSPLDGGIVTSLTNVIGTASSPILQSYVLEYRLKPADDESSSNWTVLASNTVSVVSNVLGQLDPTLSLNGFYELRLSATDTLGRSATTDPITVIFDRNLKIGQFTISFNDLAVPVPGLPLQVTRTYDSRAAAAGIQGDFGIGWTLDIRNVRLQKNRSLARNWVQTTTGSPFDLSVAYHLNPINQRIVTITFPDGRVEKFRFDPKPVDQPLLPIGYPQWRFTPLDNTRGTLVPAGFDDPDGNFLFFSGAIPGTADLVDLNFFFDALTSNLNDEELQSALERYPTLFRYTSPEGYKYLIDENDGLQSVTDPNGNTLLISTNGLTWNNPNAGTNALSIVFQRDAQGRITNIVDAAGHAMSYGYDAIGNLSRFTDRVGQTNGFIYDNASFPHHLTGITDARGITPVRNEYDASGRLVGNLDAFGNAITYGHDLANNREYITNRLGFVTVSEYDDHGNVIRTIDPLGAVTLSSYDENGNVLQTVDPLGRTNSFTYDGLDNRLTATDPLGNATRFTYSDLRRVTSVTDPRGNAITNVFDGQGNLLAMRDPLGNVTRFAYNNQGLPTAMTNALGQAMHFDYDQQGRLISEADALGHQTGYQRDANGNLRQQTTTRTTPSGLQTLAVQFFYDAQSRLTNSVFPDGSSAQTIYNAIGKPAVTIDQLGRQTVMEYDELGRVTRTILPDGSSEASGYDAEGQRIASTNRLGQVTQYDYDADGRLFRSVMPDGTSTTNYFDLAGQLIVSTDARGVNTFYGYDAAGRSVTVTNALGQVSRSAYDASGNVTNAVDALGRSTRFVYDSLNRRVQTIFADGTMQNSFYDVLGRRVAETDQSTNTTRFTYDTLGRLNAVTNALGYVTSYAYDELGQQISQTDANQHTTTFEYDSLGRRVKRTLPGNQVETYAYNIGGQLTNRIDFNGYTTTYQYDLMNRLLAKVPDSRRGEPSVIYSYNVLGLRTNMTDAAGSSAYAYDSRNRLVQKSRTWNVGQASSLSLNYSYDANGNLTNIVSSDANGVDVGYEYDALNRLIAVDDAKVGRTAYNYDDVGNLQSYSYPNGVSSVYQYDSLNRLTNLASGKVLTPIAQYAYTVSASGNRLTASEQLIASVFNAHPSTINRVYTYDSIYRLTGETINGTPSGGLLGYNYDPVGNRLTRNSTLADLLPQTFSFDANDRLNTDSYDNNGNTLIGAGFGQLQPDQYDFENRLVSRQTATNTITIQYDGDGNRVAKTVSTVTNTTTTYFVVDDLNPSGYAQVLEEHVSLNFQPSTLNRIYTYGHTLISQDRLDGSTWRTSFYGYDGHNSVRYLTDPNGFVTDTYDYDAFGNLIARSSISQLPTPNSYLFTGEQYDPDLDLYYLRARYHNPDTGRFWTEDSFEGVGSDPSSLHRYTYCGNNPVNCYDPSGKYTITELATVQVIGAVVGAVFGGYDAWRRTHSWSAVLKGAAMGAAVGALLAPVVPYLPMLMMGPAGQMTLLLYATTIGASAALDAEKYPDLAAIQVISAFLPFIRTPRTAVLDDEMSMGYNEVGQLKGDLTSLDAREAVFVRGQMAAGKTVEIIPRGPSRSPDFRIDGQLIELKTLYGVADESADGISGAIANRVMSGRGQSADIVVNARWQKGITQAIAERGIRRAYGADNKTGAKIQSIRVVGPDFDITIKRDNSL